MGHELALLELFARQAALAICSQRVLAGLAQLAALVSELGRLGPGERDAATRLIGDLLASTRTRRRVKPAIADRRHGRGLPAARRCRLRGRAVGAAALGCATRSAKRPRAAGTPTSSAPWRHRRRPGRRAGWVASSTATWARSMPSSSGSAHDEAELIDPQHRLLLEVAWQACEHAGLPIASLAGSNTGVFAGMCNPDYAAYSPWLARGGGPYLMTGNQFGTAAGRVSHMLGLRGPSMALDTSCSSGLVAAHLACQSLQQGESDMALAGSGEPPVQRRGSSPPTTSSACSRRAGSAGPSTTRPTGTCAPRAPSCSSSSAWPTRSATATASSP